MYDVSYKGCAKTCYLDLLALPAVLLLLLSPWRFSHTPWLLEDLRGKTFQQSLTVLRTWAAGQGLNGLLDWPFVAVGRLEVGCSHGLLSRSGSKRPWCDSQTVLRGLRLFACQHVGLPG